MALKTDYQNDIFTGNRKYNEITNSDGTISLEDVTEYTQEGDTFSAADINATNEAIDKIYEIYQSGVQTSSSTTTFNEDGSITTEYENGNTEDIIFNEDGSISEVFETETSTTTSVTTFNEDGSISVNISQV